MEELFDNHSFSNTTNKMLQNYVTCIIVKL